MKHNGENTNDLELSASGADNSAARPIAAYNALRSYVANCQDSSAANQRRQQTMARLLATAIGFVTVLVS
ncbi:MAG: hypothetical protein WBN92_08095 [Terriglobia bacterium]